MQSSQPASISSLQPSVDFLYFSAQLKSKFLLLPYDGVCARGRRRRKSGRQEAWRESREEISGWRDREEHEVSVGGEEAEDEEVRRRHVIG